MILHRAHPRQRGFSMLEVLIAVLVFSIGMIGLAGLLIYSIQSNHVAYLRTQATFLAHNMAARMGANPAGVWAGNYDGAYPVSGSTSACDTGCNPAALATYDKTMWSTQLKTFLPKVSGNIACATAGINVVPNAAQQDMRPPYGGTCTMSLSWNEARSSDGTMQAHTFLWTFQP